MRRLLSIILMAALLAGCQSTDETLSINSTPVAVTGPAASAIAGDMASQLAEQMVPPGTTTIKMEKDRSDFAVALEAALRGWGYKVITDEKLAKDVKPVELAYSLDGVDGQVLARVWTPSVALSRVYTATASGATPASPLSRMQRN